MTIYKNGFCVNPPLCWKRRFGYRQPNLDTVVAIVYEKGRRPAIEMLQSEYKNSKK